jgi:hypothetical protein
VIPKISNIVAGYNKPPVSAYTTLAASIPSLEKLLLVKMLPPIVAKFDTAGIRANKRV